MKQQWDEAVRLLGGVATDAADDLVTRYAEKRRVYHNGDHIEAVLREARTLGELDGEERAILTLAICAHDVVYDARPGDDERASAQWAREKLTESGLDESHIARVEQLVLATLKHESDDDLAHLLLDADLSILGSDADVYDGYAAAVRREYAEVTDDLWRQGRAAVLKSLLDREDLYVTPQAKARWDSKARANIARELSVLSEY
jgi:predicted metal-dependent HD superfamily phosphohydrolase